MLITYLIDTTFIAGDIIHNHETKVSTNIDEIPLILPSLKEGHQRRLYAHCQTLGTRYHFMVWRVRSPDEPGTFIFTDFHGGVIYLTELHDWLDEGQKRYTTLIICAKSACSVTGIFEPATKSIHRVVRVRLSLVRDFPFIQSVPPLA